MEPKTSVTSTSIPASTSSNAGTAPIMHNMNEEKKSVFSSTMLTILIVVILLGLGSGFLLASTKTVSQTGTASSGTGGSTAAKGTVVGSDDTKTFKDVAEGILEEGGLEGEGQFHLVRPGGESQYVYLTSSTIDLSQYLKKKVKVNGQTQKAQKVGWLMDVGRLEVLE